MIRIVTISALISLVADVEVAGAASSEDVVNNLLVGQCISEVTGTPRPSGFIDPQKIGKSVQVHKPEKVVPGLQIATDTGTVTYYRDPPFCSVQTSNVDAVRVIARIEDSLKKLGRTSEKTGTPQPGPGASVVLITMPGGNPQIAAITIQYGTNPPGGFRASVALAKSR